MKCEGKVFIDGAQAADFVLGHAYLTKVKYSPFGKGGRGI